MKDIKIKYIAQHEDTGLWMEQIFTLAEIEGSDFINQWQKKFPRWNIVARSLWTEMKDKHRKEIYEGDVLWKNGIAKWEVIYSNLHAGFILSRQITENEIEDWSLSENYRELEVIGNIYDNPKFVKNVGIL